MSIAEKLTAIAENEQKVFDAGKKDYYDVIWDCIQNGGNIVLEMTGLFCGSFWNDDTFRPKYDIVLPTSSQYLFKGCRITDLKGLLEKCGKTFNSSNATNFYQMFSGSTITRIPTVDARKASVLSYTFNNCAALKSVDKLIVSASTTYEGVFHNCSELEDIIFDGTIGQNFMMYNCDKLTHDSLMSILNALEAKTEGTWTVTLGTTNLAKLTDAEKAIATQKGWTLA